MNQRRRAISPLAAAANGSSGAQCYALQTARDGADFAIMTRYRSVLVAVLASLALGPRCRRSSAPCAASRSRPPARRSSRARRRRSPASAAQIEASKIATATVGPGVITRRITAPAAVKPDPDKIARVAAKVAGVVEEMRKRLGDQVARGETIASIDSREVAEAKSEYLAASANFDLQNVLFQREKGLFEKKITAEQLFLKAKTVFMEAKVKLDLARQKLAALMSEQEIAPCLSADRRSSPQEIRAPISGRVIERLVSVGQPVGARSRRSTSSPIFCRRGRTAVPPPISPVARGQEVRMQNAEGRGFEGKITTSTR
jgi:cobalt-zinc-cadmium efflux system membrane fusion protein